MQTALFDYRLPPELIAQTPVEPRDHSRLLVLDRRSGRIEHRRFYELGDFLAAGDLLVANDSRVIPARLHGRRSTGGAIELLLLRQLDEEGCLWECLLRGKKLVEGSTLHLGDPGAAPITATVVAVAATGVRQVRFAAPIRPYLDQLGEMPLPPYITHYVGDRERYQTIYSRPEGSAAAPTAGLHFTPELLLQLRNQGVGFETVTLHVGLDTFRPVESAEVEEHVIHSEWAELSATTAQRINQTSLQDGRIVAIGTTTARTLEWAARPSLQSATPGDSVLRLGNGVNGLDSDSCPWRRVQAFAGSVNLFIYPGYRFAAIDGLLTNFHLPRSSLLLLVSAFIGQLHPDDRDAGRRILLESYAIAIHERYRFYSFGDAMLIV
jgi:S-adenosylmethionine:tRNA ribosyltransferase-isomerase